MRILGIESASLVASVAIVTDDVITAEYTVNLKKTHSQTLLPMIDEIVKEQYITDIHALIAELNERGERVIFLGDGVPVNRVVIEEEMKVPYSFAPAQASRQRASAVAALGAVYLAEGKTETAAEHKPDYLRKSQAEREREVAERQGEMDKLAAGIVVVEKK